MTTIKKHFLSFIFLAVAIVLLFRYSSSDDGTTSMDWTAQELLDQFNEMEHIGVDQVEDFALNTDQYVFVDLRDPYDYDLTHIENARNIPMADLLEEDNLAFFEECNDAGMTIVLYGESERDAIAPWMLMYEQGMTHFKILKGGMDCYQASELPCPDEMAKYDYAKIAAQGGIKEVEVRKKRAPVQETAPPPVEEKKEIEVEKKRKVEAEGGC